MSEFLNNKTSPFEGLYPDGHPVRTYLEENLYMRELMHQLESMDPQEQPLFYKELFEKLAKVELHFARKENQLFPYLEKYGWTSPSQGMWTFHDQIRDQVKLTRKAIESGDEEAINENMRQLFAFLGQIINVEEGRLFPRAMSMLKKEEWKEFKEGVDTPPHK